MGKAISKVLQYTGDPLIDLAKNMAVSVGVEPLIAEVTANAAKIELGNAIKQIEERGKRPKYDYGFDLIWKISHRAAVKSEMMKMHWRNLLRSALDPEFQHEIRMEDVDFLDTLNPADALLIDVVCHHRKELNAYNATNKNYGNLFSLIGNGHSDITDLIQDYFIDPGDVLECYAMVYGSRVSLARQEVAAVIQTRSDFIYEDKIHQNSVLELHGYINRGIFKMKAPETGKMIIRKIGSPELTNVFGIGYLTVPAQRIAGLLKVR